MSIPTPFNPLGTLGTRPDYIRDGLILWFDALLETPGTKDSLTNFASGTQCQFTKPLTVGDGFITNNGTGPAQFNTVPLQPIDGNMPYGANYSADLCATTSDAGGEVEGLLWAENISGAEKRCSPCFQLYSKVDGRNTVVRLNDILDEYNISAIGYEFGGYKSLSLHMEFSRLFMGGEEITQTYKPGGAVGFASLVISAQFGIHCYRLYNRKLTVAEQRHNYALDKARFGTI